LKRSLFVVALAGAALVSFEARAQMSTIVKPIQFGIAGGIAIPLSDLNDVAGTGFNGTVTVGLNPAMIPLGIRIDGAYNQFGIDDDQGGGDFRFTSVTGNLVYKIPAITVSPYLIGGGGWYHVSVSDNAIVVGPASDDHFGWNIGGGISMALSGFDTFIEARYNQIQVEGGSTKFVPITFGVMF
jgi:opacity protein-like surface antigen